MYCLVGVFKGCFTIKKKSNDFVSHFEHTVCIERPDINLVNGSSVNCWARLDLRFPSCLGLFSSSDDEDCFWF